MIITAPRVTPACVVEGCVAKVTRQRSEYEEGCGVSIQTDHWRCERGDEFTTRTDHAIAVGREIAR